MARYDNIFLTDTATAYKFTSLSQRGSYTLPHIADRNAHSQKLIAQFNEARTQFVSYTPQQVAAMSYNNGTYVEFSGAVNCDLITKGLEDQRQGIRLLNIRDVVSQDGSNDFITRATVFIPKGKEEVFIKKITEYTELTEKGNPKNNNLVSSIDSISNAIKMSAFWIGRPSEMPSENQKWFELWLDAPNNQYSEVLIETFSLFNSLNLTHRSQQEVIYFPERIVVPIYANCQQILDLIKLSSKIAEVRKPADPNLFFVESTLSEQEEWVNNLSNRTQFNDSGVAVCILDTGVNKNHSLITPFMPDNGMTAEITWGIEDNDGHGTKMAGVALYNDLKRYLITDEVCQLNHTIESVKLLEDNHPISSNLYGFVTGNAVLLPEINAPLKKRVYCMAITDSNSGTNDGQPSSWSSAIDNLAFEGNKRLFIISAGNVETDDLKRFGYPDACLIKPVEDPAQSWNALTVGAYSIDTEIDPRPINRGYSAVAKYGELSPYSTTSETWQKQWPIKPEIVCDGGNMMSDGTNYSNEEELSKLTLSHNINQRLFDLIEATSAATAQCSYIAAELMAYYPNMRLETLRALIVHSARWTDAMKLQFCSNNDTKTSGRRKLLRACGYGVPSLERAKNTLNNSVNMIIEDEIQPYSKSDSGSPKMNEMKLHELPWPKEVLQQLENTNVKIRITLSYFIEPGPGQKGWRNKYRYASCGLRFDIKRPHETLEEFQQRINKAMRDENYQSSQSSTDKWYLGPNNRDVGSIHSDVWDDTAIDLVQSNYIAIYPVIGWWRERANLKKYNLKLNYSLIVTVETPSEQIDFYTPIMTEIRNRIPVDIERNQRNN